MASNTNRTDGPREPAQAPLEPLRTDRTVSSDDADVAAAEPSREEEPVVIGPEKARAGSTNRMPARVLLISITLTAAAFAIGYLLVR